MKNEWSHIFNEVFCSKLYYYATHSFPLLHPFPTKFEICPSCVPNCSADDVNPSMEILLAMRKQLEINVHGYTPQQVYGIQSCNPLRDIAKHTYSN